MEGMGHIFLEKSINSILEQDYKDYEIILSDNSSDNEIENVFKKYFGLGIDIKYFRNEGDRTKASINLNNCIRNSKGDIIKILFQDDFLYTKDSLKETVDVFLNNSSVNWLATSCCHTRDGEIFINYRDPRCTEDILFGNNQIGSPSVISLRNLPDLPEFDPQFNWLMDCDYYYRMIEKYGDPYLLLSYTVVIRIWGGQMTNTIPYDKKLEEHNTIVKKFNKR